MTAAPDVFDVLTFGETMANLRGQGAMRLGGTFKMTVAGAESNVAVGLARLGHRVRWAGRVGADETGALVLRTLRAEGVDVTAAGVDEDAPTGLMLLEHRTADLVRVEYHRKGSAASRIRPAALTPALADGARLLHVTGITPALSPTAADSVAAAVEHAHAHGWTVCLDVNHRPRLWSRADAARALRPLLSGVDILVASADELAIVVDDEQEPEKALLGNGIREVVVTDGKAGAHVVDGTGRIARPAASVTAVDPVGAGDAFVAGYLSARLDGLPVTERLDRAVAVAGFAVATYGDWEGLPTRAELALAGHRDGTVR
ncbi:MAG: sugar kinase [Streptosporangiales bacterium]|nr:sugar kinase [Streptosporangiales bacterium]MBO0891254.1 sugar kinase [Acidothermales bacterium]